MNNIVVPIINLIEELLTLIPSGGSSTAISNIITILEKILPLIVGEVETLYQPMKNIIATLLITGKITPVQVATLQALDNKMDDEFDAAAKGLDPDATA